jgi:hypothetical protein
MREDALVHTHRMRALVSHHPGSRDRANRARPTTIFSTGPSRRTSCDIAITALQNPGMQFTAAALDASDLLLPIKFKSGSARSSSSRARIRSDERHLT